MARACRRREWSGFGAILSSQDLPCHLVGAKEGHHARNICPLPPHSRPEQNGEQLKRNMTAGLWIGFLSFRYVWEICVAQIDELREVCLLSEPDSGLGGAGFPPSQELKEQEELFLLVANTPGRSRALRSLRIPSTLDDATQTFQRL